MRTTTAESLLPDLDRFRPRHRLSYEAAEGCFIVEGGEEASAFLRGKLVARLVRSVLLELLFERQFVDHVEFHGIAEKKRCDRHVVVDGGTRISLSFEPRSEGIQD